MQIDFDEMLELERITYGKHTNHNSVYQRTVLGDRLIQFIEHNREDVLEALGLSVLVVGKKATEEE